MSRVAASIGALLAARGETLAVAETSAGGLICAWLAEVPGASAWLLGGAVAYGALAKQRWLAVDAGSLGGEGAVSEHAARLLAQGARDALGATWGIGETGIAGPQTGRRSVKPAGLGYLAVAGPVPCSQELVTGLAARSENQRAFATAGLALLLRALRDAPHIPG